ncbi:hypothetical protein FGB62_58g151 [Gracilaria domingensis]|nr:hypothetical protein FGB62_58g151 [Gracilaria domingensis]
MIRRVVITAGVKGPNLELRPIVHFAGSAEWAGMTGCRAQTASPENVVLPTGTGRGVSVTGADDQIVERLQVKAVLLNEYEKILDLRGNAVNVRWEEQHMMNMGQTNISHFHSVGDPAERATPVQAERKNLWPGSATNKNEAPVQSD